MRYGICRLNHYNDVIMSTMASQITSIGIVYSTVYSRLRSKKTSKLRVTGLCAGNSPGTGEFPEQMASYAENVSIWWRHHGWPDDIHVRKRKCHHWFCWLPAACLAPIDYLYQCRSIANSLWPNDAIRRHRSALAQVMACCLTANHYLNQCLFLISRVLWHWRESNFT